MPIIKPTNSTAPVFYPKNDYPIVKYLDVIKFISALHKQSLFFCRLDKLEDQFEGITPKTNFDTRVKWYQDTNHLMEQPLSEPDIIKKVEDLYEFEKKFKRINCVNCWNKYNGESAALWKIYSDFNKGIMIKSSTRKLEMSMEKTEQEINLSEIKYLDYSKEIMLDGNTTYPIIHKQKAYSYEEEVRLIYEIVPEFGWEYDWANEEVEEGFYIKAEMQELIEEVIVSPYSPKWFFQIIEDISNKYGLNCPVNKSQLSFE